MTLDELILHHTYTSGSCFDVSMHGNHGDPSGVFAGIGEFADAVYFGAGDPRVRVAQTPTLQDLRAIRAEVAFYLIAPQKPRRHNLIEGHLSFALFVNPDRSLQGTILNSDGDWTGVSSPAGTVEFRQVHRAQLRHDGISRVDVLLDDTVVGTAWDAPGPVRGVGDLGVAIGAWPDGPEYAFSGYLDDAKLFRRTPGSDVWRLLDPCCADRAAIDTLLDRLRVDGWTTDDIVRWGRQFVDLAVRITAKLRGGTEDGTRRTVALTQAAIAALYAGDAAALDAARQAFLQQAAASQQPDRLAELQAQLFALLNQLPVKPEELTELARALCVPVAATQPQPKTEDDR